VALDLPDYEPAFAMAIEQFWEDRAGQMARQRLKGLTDAGTRENAHLPICAKGMQITWSEHVRFAGFCANHITDR
jgi:hypothetical protein